MTEEELREKLNKQLEPVIKKVDTQRARVISLIVAVIVMFLAYCTILTLSFIQLTEVVIFDLSVK